MSNATIIAAAFGEGADLYEILTVERDATAAQLRKAYYRSSLSCHPDKIPGKEAQFHALTVAYTILRNPESRAEYDESGELVDPDDEDGMGRGGDGNTFHDLKRYFSSIFGAVTTNKIDAFAEKYKCSEEEEADVTKYYIQFKGHVGKMLQNVMLSTEKDAQRWMEDYLLPAIRLEQVPDYTKQLNKTLKQCLQKAGEEIEIDQDNDDEDEDHMEADDDDDDDATESDDDSAPQPVTKASKKSKAPSRSRTTTSNSKNNKTKPPAKKARKTKAQWEAEQAEALIQKIRGTTASSSSSSQQQQQLERLVKFDSLVSGLAAKYGGPPPKSKSRGTQGPGKQRKPVLDDDPLDDDAFEKIQAKLVKNANKNNKKEKSNSNNSKH